MAILDFEDTFGNDPCIDVNITNKRDFCSYYNGGVNKFRITKDGFFYTTSGWAKRYVQLGLGDIPADADDYAFPLFVANVPVTITNVEIATDTTVSADADNYQTIRLYQSGSSTSIADAMTTNSTGFTKHVPRAFSNISSSLGSLGAGTSLYLQLTKSGTGMTLSGVTVAVTFEINIPESESGTATDNVIRVINGGAGTDGFLESDHVQRDHLRIRRNGETVLVIDVDGIIKPGDSYVPPDQYYFHVANVGTIVDADGGAKKSPIFKPVGTVKIEKIYYGVNQTLAADDDTNYTQILIKDGSGNILTDAYANGPTTESDLTAGRFYDMGDINETYANITSSEQIQAEYVCNGTAPDVPGLTFVVVFRKLD